MESRRGICRSFRDVSLSARRRGELNTRSHRANSPGHPRGLAFCSATLTEEGCGASSWRVRCSTVARWTAGGGRGKRGWKKSERLKTLGNEKRERKESEVRRIERKRPMSELRFHPQQTTSAKVPEIGAAFVFYIFFAL